MRGADGARFPFPFAKAAQTCRHVSEGATNVTDTEAPVITTTGNNPAEINVGDTYADLGATVTDNVNGNLGIKASVDGGVEIDISAIYIDTGTVGSHSIIYRATDAAGNVGTAERIVNVVDPNAPPAGGTVTEPPPVEEPPPAEELPSEEPSSTP